MLHIESKVNKVVVVPKVCFPAGCVDLGPLGDLCTPAGCTPELAFPGFKNEFAAFCSEKSPPKFCLTKVKQDDVATLTDSSLVDKNRAPWTLGGFSPISGAAIVLDPNRPPVPVISAPTGVYEGDSVTFKSNTSRASDCTSDAETQSLSATWDFGDGTPAATGASPKHVFPDNGTAHAATGSYNVKLTQDDGAGFKSTATLPVTVQNRPPNVSSKPASVAEGSVVNGAPYATASSLFTVSDPGLRDTLTVDIGWGDTTADNGLSVPSAESSPTSHPWGRSHVYADDGTYEVTVKAADDDKGVSTGTSVVTVTNVAPSIVAKSAAIRLEPVFPASGSSSVDVSLVGEATFHDPGTADTHQANLTWGAGQGETGFPIPASVVTESPVAAPGSVSGLTGRVVVPEIAKRYAAAGTYDLNLHVRDDDGGVAASTMATVRLPASDLQLTFDAAPSPSLLFNAETTQTLTARVVGSEAVDSVVLTSILDKNMEFLSAAPSGGSGGNTYARWVADPAEDLTVAAGAKFGSHMASDGDYAAVATTGQVLVVKRYAALWKRICTMDIQVPTGLGGPRLALNGDLLVSAVNGQNTQVWQIDTGNDTCSLIATLASTETGSVAISNSLIVVGRPHYLSGLGDVSFWDRKTRMLIGRMESPVQVGAIPKKFGEAVAIDETPARTRVVVTMSGRNRVYVYQRNGDAFALLRMTSPGVSESFGSGAAADNGQVLVYAPGNDPSLWKPLRERPGFAGWSDDYATILPLMKAIRW